jgi:agmatinase
VASPLFSGFGGRHYSMAVLTFYMSSKKEILLNFDPNGPASQGKLFGLPFDEDTADIIIIPVPWEVTVSYSKGTANGPEAILAASVQVDLFLKDIPEAWSAGIYMLPVPENIKADSAKNREAAAQYIQWLEQGSDEGAAESMNAIPEKINQAAENLNTTIQSQARKYLQQGKLVGLLGGDHSTPLGLIRAMGEAYPEFGILQIDAHADLRKAYEDFTYSHASISYNALQIEQVKKIVQVGIRDLGQDEYDFIMQDRRVKAFFDEDIKKNMYKGKGWHEQCRQIVEQLPEHVYITFDIDGLDPKLCPNTGTPVPGGLEFNEAVYLIKAVVYSGRKIIGFDLNEVSPGNDEWDANVGARMLYHMSNLMAASQGRLNMK